MNSFKIILADDHVLLRQGLKKIIEGAGGLEVVGEAGDGLELLSLFHSVVPDLVILDISMPNLRGIEAIHEIKRRCPETRILVLTMYREYLHQALSAGAEGYLVKEDADRELFSAIESIRQRKIFISPRLRDDLDVHRLPPFEPLSLREKEILKLIAEGHSNKEISENLFISVRTVENHRASILDKLKLKHTADLVKYAIQRGYL